MLSRRARVEDGQTTGKLMRSVPFFASTAIFVAAGPVAGLGTVDRGPGAVFEPPLTAKTSKRVGRTNVILPIAMFVPAALPFSGSLR